MNGNFYDEPIRLNPDGRFEGGHPSALLPAYATGALERPTLERVRTHLSACARCQRELAEWQAISVAVRETTARVGLPRQAALNGALAAIAQREESHERFEWFERIKGMLNSNTKRAPRSMVAVAAAAALAVAVVFTPVGSYAEGILTIFTPKQVAAVPVSQQELQSLPKLNDYGTFTMPSRSNGKQATSAAEASSLAGYSVLVPSSLPKNVPTPARYEFAPGQNASFTFSAQKAEATAAKQGKQIPAMPTNLNGSTLVVTTKPAVITTYTNGSFNSKSVKNMDEKTLESQNSQILIIGQMPAPVVTSTGASASEIEQYLLAQPGISPDLAQAIRAIGDPTTTLPIPVPVDRAASHSVQVQGVTGLAVADQTGLGGGIIWEKNGYVYGVAGTYSESDLLNVANSLH